MPINEDIQVSTVENLPEGPYTCEVHDVAIVEGKNFNTKLPEKKIEFKFVVVDGEEKGETISRRTTFKYTGGNMESVLFSIVKAIAGATVVADGINTTFLNSLIGARIGVVVKHTTDAQGRTWANADTFFKAPQVAQAAVTTPATAVVEAAPTPVTPTEVEATPEYPAI